MVLVIPPPVPHLTPGAKTPKGNGDRFLRTGRPRRATGAGGPKRRKAMETCRSARDNRRSIAGARGPKRRKAMETRAQWWEGRRGGSGAGGPKRRKAMETDRGQPAPGDGSPGAGGPKRRKAIETKPLGWVMTRNAP